MPSTKYEIQKIADLCYCLIQSGGYMGKDGCAKSDEFSEKFQGGGRHFQSKKLCDRFWELGLFEHEIDIKEKFQGSGYVFFNNCIEKTRMVPISRNQMHSFHTIWPSYLLAYLQPYPL